MKKKNKSVWDRRKESKQKDGLDDGKVGSLRL